MKKSLCITALIFLLMLAGCSSYTPNTSGVSLQSDQGAANITFLTSMGCNDQDCTNASHYHDCPPDCTDYNHYHSCALDCTEAEHHHSQTHHQEDHQTNATGVIKATFVSGMGCSDESCTDASHHHDCPPDCTDYDHYHNCNLNCTEKNHHHSSQIISGGHGRHHADSHH